jgi:hypothetical protein
MALPGQTLTKLSDGDFTWFYTKLNIFHGRISTSFNINAEESRQIEWPTEVDTIHESIELLPGNTVFKCLERGIYEIRVVLNITASSSENLVSVIVNPIIYSNVIVRGTTTSYSLDSVVVLNEGDTFYVESERLGDDATPKIIDQDGSSITITKISQ